MCWTNSRGLVYAFTLIMSTTSRVKEHTSIVIASVTTKANTYIYSVGMGLHIFCKRVPHWFLFPFGSGIHLLQLHGSFFFYWQQSNTHYSYHNLSQKNLNVLRQYPRHWNCHQLRRLDWKRRTTVYVTYKDDSGSAPRGSSPSAPNGGE